MADRSEVFNLIGPIPNQILCTNLIDGYADYMLSMYCNGFPSQFSHICFTKRIKLLNGTA